MVKTYKKISNWFMARKRYNEFIRFISSRDIYPEGVIYSDENIYDLVRILPRTKIYKQSELLHTSTNSLTLPGDELTAFQAQADVFTNFLIDTEDSNEFYFAQDYFFLGKCFFYEKNHINKCQPNPYFFKNLVLENNQSKRWVLDNHRPKYNPLPKIINNIERPIISLTTNNNINYFHWLHFPGLINISAALAANLGDLSKFMCYVGLGSHQNLPKYVSDSIANLGITPDQICVSPTRGERMIASYQSNPTITVSAKHIHFLRRTFLTNILSSESDTFKRRLFVSRQDTKHRQLFNEDEIYEYLRANYGFERVLMTNLSISQQAVLFNQADIIVGPHGAGLTNITFGRSGQLLIEFISPKHINSFFYRISDILGIIHGCILGESIENAPEGAFVVSLAKVKQFFKRYVA